MSEEVSPGRSRAVIATRVSLFLVGILAMVVAWYVFVAPGRVDDARFTPLGQRVEFVIGRPLVIGMLLLISAWFACKTLFIDRGSLLERCASAALGVGPALLLWNTTQPIGRVLTLAGLAGGVVALVLAGRRDPGFFTRPL